MPVHPQGLAEAICGGLSQPPVAVSAAYETVLGRVAPIDQSFFIQEKARAASVFGYNPWWPHDASFSIPISINIDIVYDLCLEHKP